jgi:hypothetical protein
VANAEQGRASTASQQPIRRPLKWP